MSKVYFTKNLDQIDKIFDAAGFSQIIAKDDSVALKIHFGEPGNQAYLKPDRVKPIVKKVKAQGGKPFWTDANTLYKGQRGDNATHLQTAHNHGYTLNRTGAEAVIADDPGDEKGTEISVNYKHFKRIYVAAGILRTNAMFVLSHFKGHEATGFGGALKNLGMGLGSRFGKLKMHQDCPNCKEIKTCQRNQNLEACWFGSSAKLQEKMTEYAAGIAARFKGKIAYITFICDVSEACDCYPHNSAPIVPDIGILASFDPVALDQACVDMVNKMDGRIQGKDKFKTIWPEVDGEIQLRYGEEIGLGQRSYEIINT